MGDAAASAHFSIGSGSKLALESAVALANYVHSEPDLESAFRKYEDARRTEVLKLQSAARNSLEWFEEVERYLDLDPVQFNYSLLTRSQRISHENLRLRDPEWLGDAEAWFQREAGAPEKNWSRAPMFAPFKLREMTLANRVVVSPMAQYKAVDGCPTDWHFTHYAERAKGGAGLLYIEMTCVSPEGRITPGCPGFYRPEHEVAWKRLVDFVHGETQAKICAQIGHAGAKASTQVGWEEGDAPLPEGNWPIMSASAVPWSDRNQTPKAMTRADMDMVRDQFVASAEMADRCGFDMLEIHAAHGYLLSSFITPLTNNRTDDYGGSLENRMR
jgi:anthraniloyl-CoA monooxygenase